MSGTPITLVATVYVASLISKIHSERTKNLENADLLTNKNLFTPLI